MNEPTNREVAVLNTALELRPAQRAAYLEEACARDAAPRQQLEDLLRADAAAEGFLEARPAGLGAPRTVRLTATLTEKPGDRIGHYKLLQQIGEGGCGVVYMAEREEPVRRRVALKVIKLGMDTKQVVARFDAERQALALMDHPNIAKVLEAGATETGRPGRNAPHDSRKGAPQAVHAADARPRSRRRQSAQTKRRLGNSRGRGGQRRHQGVLPKWQFCGGCPRRGNTSPPCQYNAWV